MRHALRSRKMLDLPAKGGISAEGSGSFFPMLLVAVVAEGEGGDAALGVPVNGDASEADAVGIEEGG